MLHRLILAVALMGFLGAVTLPNYTAAQTTTEDTKTKKAKAPAKKKEEKADADKKEEPKAKTVKKKPPTAKQLAARKKFADCAKSWGDHKKATGEKTRKQYNAYMSKCLKKDN